MKKIGILGSGIVAKTLGAGSVKHGYQIMLGTRDPFKLNDWAVDLGSNAQIGTFAQAAAFGDIIVLAVHGSAAKVVLESAGAKNLEQKTIIDACNPIGDAAPVNGVLNFFTDPNSSLMEALQASFPEANFVKAFNSVGSAFMVNPTFESKPSMFICGNSTEAKREVTAILDAFGWETEDFGMVESARAIEPLCMLWCIRGFRDNAWTHAFKLLKQ